MEDTEANNIDSGNLHLNLGSMNSFWEPEDEKRADQDTLAQTSRSCLAQKKAGA